MEDLFLALMVMAILAAILWGIVFVLKLKETARNNAQPIQTESAKLVDMQQIPAGQIVIGEIWTMFELNGGNRIRLNAKVQNTLVIGDEGVLTWQGNKILNFERSKGS